MMVFINSYSVLKERKISWLLIVFLGLSTVSSSSAIVLNPTEKQTNEAIAYGQEHKDNIEEIKREYSALDHIKVPREESC